MKYEISFSGRVYEVEVDLAEPMDEGEFRTYAPAAPVAAPAPVAATASSAPATAAAPVVAGDGACVTAPMPGNILKVNVSVGDVVKEGQVLVILEAMKMENEIMAPKAGTVSQVLVAKGTTVDTGAAMVVIA